MRCFATPLLQGLAWCLGRLPQGAMLMLGRTLAWLAWPLLGSRRRVARINVDLCFPGMEPRARRRLADASVVNTVIGALELVRAWHIPASRLDGMAEVTGLEHLRAALATGQGVLLVTGHFTCSELAGRLLGHALGRPIRVVVRRHNNACLEAWFDRSREAVYGPTIGKKDVRGLIRALQAGEPVAYSADQNFNYQSAFVPFFGVPAATLSATPEIMRRGRALMLPFWFHRGADGRYRIRIEAAWEGWPTGDPHEDAARYMRELEKVVLECPEQYLWAHRRFKTRPPGHPPVY